MNKAVRGIEAQLAGLNEQELRRLLIEHLSTRKLGLNWESSAIERDRALNSDIVLPRVNYAQSLRYLLRMHGIRKDDLGVTPHGLRHQFGTDLFMELTGLPAPVLEKVPHEVYEQEIETVRAALLEISRQMGHERPSISGAYLSSVPKMGRVKTARLADWLAQLGQCGEAFAAAGVVEAWVVGKGAFGLPLEAGEPLHVAVRLTSADSRMAAAIEQLEKALAHKLAIDVGASVWLKASRPPDGAEILFAATSARVV